MADPKDMSNAPAGKPAIADAPDGTPRPKDDLIEQLETMSRWLRDGLPMPPKMEVRVDRAIARIRELEAEREWKPIDEAAKDARKVDLWYPALMRRVPNCWWSTEDQMWLRKTRTVTGEDGIACYPNTTPSHYMLPPKPPAAVQVAEGSRAAALHPTQPTKEKDNG